MGIYPAGAAGAAAHWPSARSVPERPSRSAGRLGPPAHRIPYRRNLRRRIS